MNDTSAKDYGKDIDIRLYNSYLNYYMHLSNPEKLSDEDWAEKLQDLHFIRQQEKKASEAK